MTERGAESSTRKRRHQWSWSSTAVTAEVPRTLAQSLPERESREKQVHIHMKLARESSQRRPSAEPRVRPRPWCPSAGEGLVLGSVHVGGCFLSTEKMNLENVLLRKEASQKRPSIA